MNIRLTVRAAAAAVMGFGIAGGAARSLGAAAQGPPPMPGGMPAQITIGGGCDPTCSNAMDLLLRPDVQNGIRLSSKQKQELKDLEEQWRKQMRRQEPQKLMALQGLSPEQRLTRMSELSVQSRTMFHGDLSDE